MADGPQRAIIVHQPHLLQRCHPACCGHYHEGSVLLALPHEFLSPCTFSTLTTCQSMVEFYLLLAFSRFLRYGKNHTISVFFFNRDHHFRTTSIILIVGVKVVTYYFIDHSGDKLSVSTRKWFDNSKARLYPKTLSTRIRDTMLGFRTSRRIVGRRGRTADAGGLARLRCGTSLS